MSTADPKWQRVPCTLPAIVERVEHMTEPQKRLRAALALGDLTKVEALADRLQENGSRLGLKRLRSLWQGRADPSLSDYRDIAEATGLPAEFFTVEDLHEALASEPAPRDELATINERLTTTNDRLDQLAREVLALRALATQRVVTDAAAAQAEAPEVGRGKGRRSPGAEGTPQ